MARPYAYARFGKWSQFSLLSIDKEIQAKRKLYDQPTSSLDSYNQINESLVDIQNIMRKNIDIMYTIVTNKIHKKGVGIFDEFDCIRKEKRSKVLDTSKALLLFDWEDKVIFSFSSFALMNL